MSPRLCAPILAACLVALAAASAANPVIPSHIRCLEPHARKLFVEALGSSTTVARLASLIERSDVVMFLVVRLQDDRLAGRTAMVTSAPGARYVLVTLDPRAPATDLVGRLAHEMQHVAEIAAAPEVKDELAMARLFSRIGWQGMRREKWETQAAIDTGRQAAAEAASRPARLARLSPRGVSDQPAAVDR